MQHNGGYSGCDRSQLKRGGGAIGIGAMGRLLLYFNLFPMAESYWCGRGQYCAARYSSSYCYSGYCYSCSGYTYVVSNPYFSAVYQGDGCVYFCVYTLHTLALLINTIFALIFTFKTQVPDKQPPHQPHVQPTTYMLCGAILLKLRHNLQVQLS